MQIKSNEAIKREQQLVLEGRNRNTDSGFATRKRKVAQAEKIKKHSITRNQN
jgi:hypothetical protein